MSLPYHRFLKVFTDSIPFLYRKSTSFIGMAFLMALFILTAFYDAQSNSVLAEPKTVTHIEDKNYWKEMALSELNHSLKQKLNDGIAKNVIIFIGDGMGVSTITASRIYQGQKDGFGEASRLSFESFPVTGLSKTYNTNKQTPDSASTGTALFSGIKTKHEMLGLDIQAPHNSCHPELNKNAQVTGIMTWAQEKNKATGIVTTTSVTDATPAATYAHSNYRYWDCDSKIPPNLRYCVKDLARQLVEDSPGNKFKVILGGGRGVFGNVTEPPYDGSCLRSDGLNLVNEWRKTKNRAVFVNSKEQLEKTHAAGVDYLLGLFGTGHLPFLGESDPTRPSLPLMTTKAIELLSKEKNGFVLMVEGGRIDQAHHKNYAKLSLMETVEFSEAITAAKSLVNLEETLIIVTADHSHPLTMSGYSNRGDDILGFADTSNDSFYETLAYTNGPGASYHQVKLANVNCSTTNCSTVEASRASYVRDTRNDSRRSLDPHYQHWATVYRGDDTHGGEDVAIYAIGPKSHLLSGVHEQNYIAHVMSCAACIGPQENLCCAHSKRNSAVTTIPNVSLMSYTIISAVIILH